jgi:RNA polymerase sigma-70 factor (ECF subfamily)
MSTDGGRETRAPYRADLEEEVRAQVAEGALDVALELALRAYGREVGGLLVALHRNEADAGDVFAVFCEDLWRSLPSFRWECSLRTYAYTIARRASYDFLQAATRRGRRNLPLSQCSALSRLPAAVRTETATFLRVEARDALASLREQLSADDNALLVLRVDRRLAWNDIARIMVADERPDGERLQRESARLRKQYEAVKRRLVEIGRRVGVYPAREA